MNFFITDLELNSIYVAPLATIQYVHPGLLLSHSRCHFSSSSSSVHKHGKKVLLFFAPQRQHSISLSFLQMSEHESSREEINAHDSHEGHNEELRNGRKHFGWR
jgi:hypothetical protein